MSTPNDGGPAFPNAQRLFDNDTQSWAVHSVGGMTLRDWFAGMALQGEVANPSSGLFEADSITFTELAEDCYRMADAMLSARERKEPS